MQFCEYSLMLQRAIRLSSIISVPIWVNSNQIYPSFGNFLWSDGKVVHFVTTAYMLLQRTCPFLDVLTTNGFMISTFYFRRFIKFVTSD